jgi:membrane-associated phospholipid phosphatase
VRGRPHPRTLRLIAWSAVCAGIAVPLARRRLSLRPAVSAAAVVAAPFGLAIAVPRSRKRDVGVYTLAMWTFTVLHELPYDDREALERRVRIDYPISCDTAIGLGLPPTLRLQRVFGRPGRTRALDHVLTWVHWAWFFEPHAVAAWILWRHPRRFTRSALMISSLFHLGALVYVAVPTAPPWWAAEQGRLPKVRRIMVEVGQRVWGDLWPHLYDFLGGNPVAAMPSLHFSSSLMAAYALSELGPVEGALGWAYAGTLGFALVYLGEHYVIDLLAGLALARGVRRLGDRVAPALVPVSRAIGVLEARARG